MGTLLCVFFSLFYFLCIHYYRKEKKNKERIQKFNETGDRKYIYKNELDKACFQHDMNYGDFKDLTKRTASDKVLREKAFKIASNQKFDGYQRGLASMVYKFLDNYTNQLLENF